MDDYRKGLEERLIVKQQNGAIGEDLLKNFYSESQEDIDNIAKFRLELSLNFWAQVILAVVISKTVYPRAIRFSKYCKLEGFLNQHMGALPMILIANGIVLGTFSGAFQAYQFNQQLEQKKMKEYQS